MLVMSQGLVQGEVFEYVAEFFLDELIDIEVGFGEPIIYVIGTSGEQLERVGLACRDDTIAGGTFVQPGVVDSADAHFFTIVVNGDLGIGEAIITLAHECIHVAQYLSGDLRVKLEGDSMVTRWKGSRVDETLLAYEDLPWEIEAYGLQDELVDSLLADPESMEYLGMQLCAA